MNTLLVFTVLFAGACMADVSHVVAQKPIAILASSQDASPDGSYSFSYETENGIIVQEQRSADGTVHGSYSYPNENGPIVISYSAGDKGFNAEGDSVPPIPEHVFRTVAYNSEHPYKEPALV